MFDSIYQDLQRQVRHGDVLVRIILVNVGVFLGLLLMSIIVLVAYGTEGEQIIENTVVRWLSVPSSGWALVWRPFSVLTYMFLHRSIWHLLSNMLLVYYFGRIIGDLCGRAHTVPIYLLGGLAGAFFFILSSFLFPVGSYCYGASASAMAMVLAAATLSPDYSMRLIVVGDVKIKYIAIFLLVLDLVSIQALSNTGGHIAHLGGAAMGWFFVKQLQSGRDLSAPLYTLWEKISNIVEPKPHLRVERNDAPTPPKPTRTRSPQQDDDQASIDKILEKIKANGYDNLSADEKFFLFNASNKGG